MSKLMMQSIEQVLLRRLNIKSIDDAEHEIYQLDDEQKIDLLDALIEATMTYGDHYRGGSGSAPTTPIAPINSGNATYEVERVLTQYNR